MVWGKGVDDAVDSFRRTGGVECAKDQVARFRSSQRELDGFQVAHFTHEDDVRVFAEGGSQRVRERQGMDAHLPLIHETFFCLVDEFDRIFDRDDVAFKCVVQIIDHGGQRRRFTRPGWAGHKNQPLFPIAELPHDRRHAELLHRNDRGGNVPEDGAKPPVLDEDVDAESGDVAQFKGKIALALFFEIFPLGIAHHVIDQGVRLFRGQCGMIEFLEVPVHTDHRWLAGADVTIRRALLCREGQKLRNIHEEDSPV